MNYLKNKLPFFLSLFFCFSLLAGEHGQNANTRTSDYFPLLKNKRVALVANAGSVIGERHLLDVMIAGGVNVKKIFALEHGFRGTGDAGEVISDSVDERSGLPIVSLYGQNKKPTASMLADIDTVVFDIQDVGVRFFTYISSMGLIMEAGAEHGKEVMILDRPNPNADYVAGPVLDMNYESFVGAFPIPLVYGLTVGELAWMIKGEGWINSASRLNLVIIPMKKYDRRVPVFPEVAPSPNLPTPLSIRLYPSLALFEPTIMSIGRGTLRPFEGICHPNASFGDYIFTPRSIVGMSSNPKHQDKDCYGEMIREEDFRSLKDIRFNLDYFNKYLDLFPADTGFIESRSFFHLLLGRDDLFSNEDKRYEMRRIHQQQLDDYLEKREKYLIYR